MKEVASVWDTDGNVKRVLGPLFDCHVSQKCSVNTITIECRKNIYSMTISMCYDHMKISSSQRVCRSNLECKKGAFRVKRNPISKKENKKSKVNGMRTNNNLRKSRNMKKKLRSMVDQPSTGFFNTPFVLHVLHQ